jgi:hypothetical protein
VWAVILPDDGEAKVGLDDYLVAHSVDELLNLPVVRVPLHSPIISKKGSGRRYSVSANIEKFLCRILPSTTDPEFLATLGEKFHSPFDHQRLKGTTVVRWRGEVRVKVNGQAKPWPAAVVYYHWLRWRQDPKGQAQMVPIRRTWLPVWQAILEIPAGDRSVPEQYRTPLPAELQETTQGTLDAWRMIEWIRSQRPQKEREEDGGTFFDPHVIAMLTGQSVAVVLFDWECLELYGYIDFVKGNRYVIGKHPITPQEMDARFSSMEDA